MWLHLRELRVGQENEATSLRADEELFIRGNVDVADELFAPSFVFHDPANHEDWHGPESVKRHAAMVRAGFPDLEYTVEDRIAEGNRVSTRHRASGVHEGELLGITPTGNRVEIAGISIMRIEGGKIEEIWENYAAPGILQQLGLIPPKRNHRKPVPPSPRTQRGTESVRTSPPRWLGVGRGFA